MSGSLGRLLFPLALAFGLACASSCVSSEMRDDHHAGVLPRSSAAPSWVGQPLGWAKLEEIERWLRYDAQGYDGSWLVQGELALGEGRLTFARRDKPSAAASNSWLARLRSAQAGFQRVLTNPRRNSNQERRARQGLAQVESLLLAVRHSEDAPGAGATGVQLTRSQWRARQPHGSGINPARGGFERITLHHTANVPGTRFDGSLSDTINVMQKVQRTHMDHNGWADIGYHYLIDASGRVIEGREIRYQGAHAGGANNERNIGVCLIGNFEDRPPSAKAMASLERLISDLRKEYGIRRTGLLGHKAFKATACPGPSLDRWAKRYRQSGPRLSQLDRVNQSSRVSFSSNAALSQSSARSTGWSRSSSTSTVR